MNRRNETQMPYMPNDEHETDSNPGAAGLRGYSDEGSHGSAPTHSPAFQKWLNNYRRQLDKVLRGEREEEIGEHEVLFSREGRSEHASGRT